MNSSVVVAAGIVAAVVAIVAYVGYRRQEGSRLAREAELATRLRDLAGDDPVRLAAVDEFETRIYQRLFGVSTVGPRATATAWAFLGTVLSTAGLVAIESADGTVVDIAFYLLVALAVIFGIAFLVLLVFSVYAATSLPRISFDESYADTPEPEATPSRAGSTEAKSSETESTEAAGPGTDD